MIEQNTEDVMAMPMDIDGEETMLKESAKTKLKRALEKLENK